MRRLYALVRSDLSRSQQAVQAAHAVAQFLVDNPSHEWRNSYLIMLRCKGIKNWIREADTIWREPDLNNEITAIACYGKGERFADLRLV